MPLDHRAHHGQQRKKLGARLGDKGPSLNLDIDGSPCGQHARQAQCNVLWNAPPIVQEILQFASRFDSIKHIGRDNVSHTHQPGPPGQERGRPREVPVRVFSVRA
jgi:hypothetical protein